MSDALLGAGFAGAAAVSLAASWVLVSRLERVGARLGLSEGLLGMVAALAADAPEITAAVTALVRGDHRVGTGVALGSNVFNVAALLGLSALLAGRIALHPRVVELGGAVALWMCAASLLAVSGAISALAALLFALALFVPYLVALGVRHERLEGLRLPRSWTRWLSTAISEEELELEAAVHPPRGRARDGAVAALAVAVVVGASIGMERSGVVLGRHAAIPEIVIGGVVLAAVTSLPNAVAAIYWATRGRGAALLSTALNSNTFNVLAGLLLPGALLGLGAPAGSTTYLAASYAGMTALGLLVAFRGRGLGRADGALLILTYLGILALLLAIA